MIWKECTMQEAFLFARGREIADPQPDQFPNLPDCSADPVFFTDGSAVACLSQWRGPYSRYTPDVDAESPQWWIGEPA